MNKALFTPQTWAPPVIAVVGIGTGLGDLGPNAIEWISRAEVLVGGKRHLDLFPDHAGEKVVLEASLIRRMEEIGSLAQDRRTVLLASGDPLFFGVARRLASLLGKDRLFILPNVTSVQVLCARVCEPWDHLTAVSLHGRDEAVGMDDVFQQLRAGGKVAVFTDPVHSPKWIAEKLIASGMDGCTLTVGEDLGGPSERIGAYLPAEAAREDFSALNIVLIHPPCNPEEKNEGPAGGMVFGFPEDAFEHEAGLITKMEVRAVALAVLRLEPGLTMWDIGAGTGSVSIEASRIARLKHVFAVEQKESRHVQLLRNIARFGVSRVEAVCGRASEAIDTFPDPDRVFIGGSGKDLYEILDKVSKRLLPGGRVVQTIVMLDTLGKVTAFWREMGFAAEVTQVQVGRSSPIGKDLRLDGLNPVFIVSACRAGEA